MARIGFIGLGNMGLPMAQNLLKAGHQVEGVDVSPARSKAESGRRRRRRNREDAAARADVVITMLPAGKHVREVYLGPNGIIENANAGTLADRLLDDRCRNRARGRRRRGEAKAC